LTEIANHPPNFGLVIQSDRTIFSCHRPDRHGVAFERARDIFEPASVCLTGHSSLPALSAIDARGARPMNGGRWNSSATIGHFEAWAVLSSK
jgi:hypothetical protein